MITGNTVSFYLSALFSLAYGSSSSQIVQDGCRSYRHHIQVTEDSRKEEEGRAKSFLRNPIYDICLDIIVYSICLEAGKCGSSYGVIRWLTAANSHSFPWFYGHLCILPSLHSSGHPPLSPSVLGVCGFTSLFSD